VANKIYILLKTHPLGRSRFVVRVEWLEDCAQQISEMFEAMLANKGRQRSLGKVFCCTVKVRSVQTKYLGNLSPGRFFRDDGVDQFSKVFQTALDKTGVIPGHFVLFVHNLKRDPLVRLVLERQVVLVNTYYVQQVSFSKFAYVVNSKILRRV